MATMADFRVDKATWCPGCGDFTVLASLQKAAANIGLEPENVVIAAGIGCSGKLVQHFGSYGFHSLHGRSIPTATGIKLANHELTVIATGGDGDGYGIGFGHFVHALRRNIDLTYIVMDNHIYGLTTGQLSPTSKKGFKTKTSPVGSAEEPIHPVETAIVNGCSFVAQAFSGDVKQMTEVFEQGLKHKGFSLINCYSPCVTFNRINTYEWYKDQLKKVEDVPGYDPQDRISAVRVYQETDGLVTGVLYHEDRPVFHEAIPGGLDNLPAAADLEQTHRQKEELLAQFL